MLKRKDPRQMLFDLGDFVVDPEVTELLSYAQANLLVRRHGSGDWGRVSAAQRKKNQAFLHPKAWVGTATAESIHYLNNLAVRIQTKQARGRRHTRVSLL